MFPNGVFIEEPSLDSRLVKGVLGIAPSERLYHGASAHSSYEEKENPYKEKSGSAPELAFDALVIARL